MLDFIAMKLFYRVTPRPTRFNHETHLPRARHAILHRQKAVSRETRTPIAAFRRQAFALMMALLAACSQSIAQPSNSAKPEDFVLKHIDLAAYLDCAREQGITLLQAHRGGGGAGKAENSIAAISESLANGAVFVEIDVSRTADGTLILMHDDTLDRTTTGKGPFAHLTYEQLQQFTLVDAKGKNTGEAISTLTAALATLKDRGIAQIDLKHPTSVADIGRVLEAEDATRRSLVITYSIEQAVAVHQRLPGVMISVGVSSLSDVTAIQRAGLPLNRVIAWLGLGSGNAKLDQALAEMGVETSYGDFQAERKDYADYPQMAANGAELLSVKNVTAATIALKAAGKATQLQHACPTNSR